MRRAAGRTAMVCGALFLSGASAVIFETLWFHQASLTFGNSVWATSLVLFSFMGGLALGNALAGKLGRRVARPLRVYWRLELLIGTSGLALVIMLPLLGTVLAPIFRPLLDLPWLLNPLRLLVSSTLMLAPATAMGATLPFLVKAQTASGASFGRVLGSLYGWNTLGAVVGALGADAVLIEAFGIRGAGLFAAGLNLVAAALAAVLDRGPWEAPEAPALPLAPLSQRSWRVFAATFVCGATLLALEVVWFRFLLLFVVNTSHALALLLSIILLGIGLGGIAGAALLRRATSAPGWIPVFALASGLLVTMSYGNSAWTAAAGPAGLTSAIWGIVWIAVPLMLPVAFVSGILFTLLGAAAHEEQGSPVRAAGLLTLWNTLGSMSGAAIAGFVLLANVGIERSFFLLALCYGAVAALTMRRPAPGAPVWTWRAFLSLAVLFGLGIALFPFGLFNERFLRLPARIYEGAGARVIAAREGLTETVVYMENSWLGHPLFYRMLTNGFSMSGSHSFGRRYMKLFVYWPIALHPAPRKALLISYGVGNTAKALTDSDELTQIDVVDISKTVLEMSAWVFPDPATHPLKDPRVRVHIEDGRYHLLTTQERYDIITAEPPPPKNAGIVNLYTREYFALLRDRLAEGGIATYWLPVHDLVEPDTKAIIAAFCSAFDDCSLWNGSGLDWMLVGSRGGVAGTTERIARQWENPRTRAELEALGLEGPEQLGALFMGDAEFVRSLCAGVPPLEDDHPRRLTEVASSQASLDAFAFHVPLMGVRKTRERFENSAWIKKIWPAELRERTLAAFVVQGLINDRLLPDTFNQEYEINFDHLDKLLARTPYRTLALWMMRTTEEEVRIATQAKRDGSAGPGVDLELGIDAISRRDFDAAAEQLGALPMTEPRFVHLRAYALGRAGHLAEAAALKREWAGRAGAAASEPLFWGWLAKRFELPP